MGVEELLNELPERIEVKGKRVKGDVCNLTIEKIAGGWTVYYGGRIFAYAFTHKDSLKEALEVVKNILIKEGHMEVQND